METSSSKSAQFPLKVEPLDHKSPATSESPNMERDGSLSTNSDSPIEVESTVAMETDRNSTSKIEQQNRESPKTSSEVQNSSSLCAAHIDLQRDGCESPGEDTSLSEEQVRFVNKKKCIAESASSFHSMIETKVRKYLCQVCGLKFTTQRSKNYHFTVRHKEYVQTFPCMFCSEIFSKYYILSKHIEVAHTEFNCALCPYNTHYKHCIRYHVISKHFPELASYKCTICNKLFHRKADLKVHIRSVHCQIREFICNVCQMAFKTKNTLRKHGISLHTDLRPYACTQCDKTFKKNTNLQMHINSIHSDLRPFQCDICYKSFKNKRNLKGHQTVHTNNQSFECMICTKLFKTKANLRNHLKYVHDDAAYRFPCKLCGEAFKSKKLLEAHKEAQHNVVTNAK